MLEIAIKHKDELKSKMYSTWFQDKYKFWNSMNYYEDFTVSENTWGNHQFVSLNSAGDIIGYIAGSIDRASELIFGLNIINFTDDIFTFGLDVGLALKDIFEKFKFRKISFSVLVGNPIEKSYDKMISRYGGRVVGIKMAHIRLVDGNYYDQKEYEIFRDDYMNSKKEQVCVENVNTAK